MTKIVDKPAYQDKVRVVNKVTIAPYEERETTILLEPHVGSAGRKKDGEIIEYMIKMGEEALDNLTILRLLTQEDPDFMHILNIVLDLDDEAGAEVLEKMTLFDLAEAFQTGLMYRSGQFVRPDVQEALKKSKEGDNSAAS